MDGEGKKSRYHFVFCTATLYFYTSLDLLIHIWSQACGFVGEACFI